MIKVKDRLIKASLYLGIFFLAVQLVAILIFWRKLPPQVPLLYSRPWGEKQLASPNFLFLLPLLCLVIVTINLLLAAWASRKKERLASRLLAIFSAVFNFLCLVTVLKIITLVT